MRLERLEINGFKSFSDRSELAFDKGVTAIVGPNGCGKSNVADAITWVMGEQSAKSLRGDKMEDVIFNGSDARKPTATAEVRLKFSGVLKNVSGPAFPDVELGTVEPVDSSAQSDAVLDAAGTFSRAEAEEIIQSVAREVEVTRRLYRSGESEYLIDGQSCRLRDIHDLLMDTGLGAKAYAIIEQGKIGMILSSRPTDRRQLIEEAAGVTKYKARRRAADLKLEAAQQNLTRIDDIVFEVEKQRGTLKRQAAKARRYQKLRDEMRRWEKVLFARKYRQLLETIEATRQRLTDAREREAAAAAHVSEVESDFGRVRIELAEAESTATGARESAHASELAINRLQQQVTFDREQSSALDARSRVVAAEIELLEARRGPAQELLANRRAAAVEADQERARTADALVAESDSYETANQEIEGFEADVEAARSEVFSALNSATALRHSLEHSAAAQEKVLARLSTLQVEEEDARIEGERVERDRAATADEIHQTQEALASTRAARAARESELASARIEHEWRARTVRSREQELAGLDARLKSLEELHARRAEYGDAARTVLAQANGHVNQRGAVADYLEVEPGFERAVEAFLGDLLQYVIVEQPEHAAAGFQLLREQQAGRCGFLIAQPGMPLSPVATPETGGLPALSSVVRPVGPYAAAIQNAMSAAAVAESYEQAAAMAGTLSLSIVTRDGDLFRSPHLVVGGQPQEAGGILETKREIRELTERIASERAELARLADETAAFEASITQATSAIAALNADQHQQEKTIVGLDAQARRAADDARRVAQKNEQLARERRQAEEERSVLDQRQDEARQSITRLDGEQSVADERLTATQRRLFEAREATTELGRRAADARATHAAMVERAAALVAEIGRLEEAGRELESRAQSLHGELNDTRQRVTTLNDQVTAGETQLTTDIQQLDALRADVHSADDRVNTLRIGADAIEQNIRTARASFEAVRTEATEVDIARATAESDLTHLESTCEAAVQASLDSVLDEVQEMERQGTTTPDAAALSAVDADEAGDDVDEGVTPPQEDALAAATQQTLSAEDAIARLRAKIDRLGPVNMMAIEQYDELETRHAFLTTQRKDLVDSIAQTSEAIKRIDETTRQRFTEAFAAINQNFQAMFTTLFGGGRAVLTLLDENDPLESGIEIIAQPPGKRLQSVQLLSGGEKALTAISLMFGLFKYKPSPFCLLDEIDAPLDDANVGRFVEMLRSMQQHTQFILITHNRKTMEIADRLYGVTMEEPGVSKLISVQLN